MKYAYNYWESNLPKLFFFVWEIKDLSKTKNVEKRYVNY